MMQSERIGILLFLYTRNELSVDENTELSAWRKETPENEQLFRELENPDIRRETLKEYYKERDEVFQALRDRFPYRPDLKLSNEAGIVDEDPASQHLSGTFSGIAISRNSEFPNRNS